MKRFAVLFGILAIVVTCGSSYATAPQVRILPDIRLDVGTTKASALPEQATNAYNVMDFVTDVDDAVDQLTVSVLNIQSLVGSSVSTIDIDGATQVAGATTVEIDIYGLTEAAWVQYTVRVDDASTATSKGAVGADLINQVAVAKYSTFALNEPTIEDGVLLQTGGESDSTRQFVVCYLGSDIQLLALDSALDPSTAVDWEVYVNDPVGPDAEGDILYTLGVSGSSVTYDGLTYEIDANGQLTLTSAGSVSAGPWVVGILATNQSDPDDSDGSRIMVANALLPEATPDTATLGASVTLDDLAVQTIAAAADVYIITTNNAAKGRTGYVGGVSPDPTDNIAPGCGWTNGMSGSDPVVDSVDLEIVDLSADVDLPVAAQLAGGITTDFIAGGKAIKATLPTVSGTVGARGYNDGKVQLPGFRLQSRAYTGIASTDILTFALSIATDAATATDLPKYQMYMGSGFSGCLVGMDVRHIPSLVPDGSIPHKDMPLDTEGWHTLSCTYGVGATVMYNNVDGDTDYDAADDAILTSITAAEGWDGANELAVAKCGFQCTTTGNAANTVNVWIDNLRVYKSLYALDLALGAAQMKTALQSGDNAALDQLVAWNVTGFTDDIVSNMEGGPDTGDMAADLPPIGFNPDLGAGQGPALKHFDMDFVNPDASAMTFSTYDTKGTGRSVRIALAGDDGADGWSGALDSVRLNLATGTVAGDGDGLYAIEAYLAKLNVCNEVDGYRHPGVRVLIQEMDPNVMGAAAGYIMTLGGLPDGGLQGDPDNAWMRCVAHLYIPNCVALRGLIQVMDTFRADASNFAVPIFVDDLTLYKVDDPAIFFEADLYDS